MRTLDRKVQEVAGYPEAVLVENAGRALWEWIHNSGLVSSPPKRLLVLAGGGNNGADALVAARYAAAQGGVQVRVLTPGRLQREMPVLEQSLLRSWGIIPQEWHPGEDLPEADLVLDGLLGTGFKPPLKDEYQELIRKAAALPALRLAVDTPSGLVPGAEVFLPAHHTLSLGYPKTTLYIPSLRSACGEIHHLSIGFPPGMGEGVSAGGLISPEDLKDLVWPLDPGIHKNRRGHVAVWGGGTGTSGAPVLAAFGASSARAGLVTALVPEDIHGITASQVLSQMALPWTGFDGNWEKFDALVLGPGWKPGDGSLNVLQGALSSGLPAVLDAGALDLVAQAVREGRDLPLEHSVLTPHPGEFSRLTGLPVATLLQDPLPALQEFSRDHRCWIVFKAACVYTVSPDGRYWVCDGFNPSLATGGAGDVLSGIIGGFLSQNPRKEESVNAGVLLHQMAGKKAWDDHGWFDASRLPEAAARVLKEAGR